MSNLSEKFNLASDVGVWSNGSLVAAEYLQLRFTEHKDFVATKKFYPCEVGANDFLLNFQLPLNAAMDVNSGDKVVTCRYKDSLLLITISERSVSYEVHLATTSIEKSLELMSEISDMLPITKVEFKDSNIREIDFVGWGGDGSFTKTRFLEMVDWSDVSSNYSHNTKEALSKLIDVTPPFGGGQLMLFHGVPGTGKTFAIRCLLQKWSEWVHPVYVLDPEVFFSNSRYMMEVALDVANDDSPSSPEVASKCNGNNVTVSASSLPDDEKWILLILEDSGEMLSKDAKMHTGQGFARLLNLANGLLGQGIKILTLITTNEPIESLHDAVAREGRCLANVNFSPLSMDDSNDWLKAKGSSTRVSGSHTIASLYSILNENKQITTSMDHKKVGF